MKFADGSFLSDIRVRLSEIRILGRFPGNANII